MKRKTPLSRLLWTGNLRDCLGTAGPRTASPHRSLPAPVPAPWWATIARSQWNICTPSVSLSEARQTRTKSQGCWRPSPGETLVSGTGKDKGMREWLGNDWSTAGGMFTVQLSSTSPEWVMWRHRERGHREVTWWHRPRLRSRRCWATWEPWRCAWRDWCGRRTCGWSPLQSGRARALWCLRRR